MNRVAQGPPDDSAEFNANVEKLLSHVHAVSAAEIEAAAEEEKQQRVSQLQRMAELPRRANKFCMAREMDSVDRIRGGAGRHWWEGEQPMSPWSECFSRVLPAVLGGGMVAVTGRRGTGMTTMAVALLRAVTAMERTGLLTDTIGFEMAMSDAKAGGAQRQEFRRYEHPDVLAIDQAGIMPTNEWSSRLLFSLLNNRHNDGKATAFFFTAEGPDPSSWEEDVATKLGLTIWNRIRESGLVAMATWNPLRPTSAKF